MNLSAFWHWWIVVIVIGMLVGNLWLLISQSRGKFDGSTTHTWDDDLQEYNNPLPTWWRNLYILTLVFACGYLLLYPGLGNFAGKLGWTEQSEMKHKIAQLQAKRDAQFASFKDKDVLALSADPAALSLGHSVFVNNCAGCHGADAHGAVSFPNLTDNDWLWGGSPEEIVQTITHGRGAQGATRMPSFKDTLKPDQLQALLDFVPYWADAKLDPAKRERGMQQFAQTCAACHGPDGTGNKLLGSANLTDDIWLYHGGREGVRETLMNGRGGVMPAWDGTLSPDEIRVVAAYVYSLSHKGASNAQ